MSGSLRVVSSMATRHALADLCAAIGGDVALAAMGGVEAARQVAAGEPADIVVLAGPALAKLAAEGHVDPASIRPFAASAMAVAVPEGGARPDISSQAALKAAMSAARVAYSTGPSGDHLRQLWARWGLADAIAARAVQAPPGVPVARLLAEGQADLGVQQLSELIGQPGIAILGPLPQGTGATTIFAAGIAARSSNRQAAEMLLAGLTGSAAAQVLARHGLEWPEESR